MRSEYIGINLTQFGEEFTTAQPIQAFINLFGAHLFATILNNYGNYGPKFIETPLKNRHNYTSKAWTSSSRLRVAPRT